MRYLIIAVSALFLTTSDEATKKLGQTWSAWQHIPRSIGVINRTLESAVDKLRRH